jgi:hypothetical protein
MDLFQFLKHCFRTDAHLSNSMDNKNEFISFPWLQPMLPIECLVDFVFNENTLSIYSYVNIF